MKKAMFLGTVVAALTASPLFADPTVTTVGNGGTYDGYGPYQTGIGGEFTLYSPDLATDISYYYSGAKNQVAASTPNFQTFCVEGNEYIYGSSLSYVTFSGQSIYSDDPLTKGAAYLYSQFATGGNFGGLATYSYDPAGRSASAVLLQNAIWALMGGQEGQTDANNATNPFLIAAEAQFGGTFAGANTAGGIGYDGVDVLNLWSQDGPISSQSSATAEQDQLIYVPDGGATLMLLGIGLSGLAIFRRRR